MIWWTTGMTALAAILLTAAGVTHIARPQEHRAVLRVHRLLPATLFVAVSLALTEVAVGAGVLAFLLLAPAAAVLLFVAQAVLYCGFAVYAGVLRTRRAGVPCGCFGAGKVSWAVVARAVVLAAGSLGAAVLGVPGPAVDRWTCVAAGVVVAMAGYLIPARLSIRR